VGGEGGGAGLSAHHVGQEVQGPLVGQGRRQAEGGGGAARGGERDQGGGAARNRVLGGVVEEGGDVLREACKEHGECRQDRHHPRHPHHLDSATVDNFLMSVQ